MKDIKTIVTGRESSIVVSGNDPDVVVLICEFGKYGSSVVIYFVDCMEKAGLICTGTFHDALDDVAGDKEGLDVVVDTHLEKVE